jgi:hypothetical protein
MNSQIILILHRPHKVRRYETEQTAPMLRTITVPFVYWHQWCVRWPIQGKIFACKEPTISRMFLVLDRMVVVDKWLCPEPEGRQCDGAPEQVTN